MKLPGKYPLSRVPSPCISICTLNETTGLCEGCYRTTEEISQWPRYTDVQKRSVIAALSRRRAPTNP